MSNAKNSAPVFTVTPWLEVSTDSLSKCGTRHAVEVRADGTYRGIVVDTVRGEVTGRGRFTRSAATDLTRFAPGAA